MTTYSVADAKARLPQLINNALAGEEVVITRHGKPVVELRATKDEASPEARAAALRQFVRGMLDPGPGAPNSVELMNMIYDEPRG